MRDYEEILWPFAWFLYRIFIIYDVLWMWSPTRTRWLLTITSIPNDKYVFFV